jgi:integrase
VKERAAARPTVKQHLAAIRMLFDWLIVGQILAINPAHAVRGPKHVVKRGKTPVLTEDEARRLLDSSAVVAMRVEDYFPNGKRWWVRLQEKGGKRHEMPAHHKLEQFLDEYLAVAGIRDPRQDPPLPLGCRQNRAADRAADASHRRV